MKRPTFRRNTSAVIPPAFDLESQWQFASRWLKRALKASTLLGMSIIMVYFLSLGALPIDSLSSIGQLVAPVAFASILFFALLLCCWGVPVLFFKIGLIDGNWNQATLLPWIEAGVSGQGNISPASVPDFQRYLLFALQWTFCTLGLWWFAYFSLFMPDYFFGRPWNVVVAVVLVVLSAVSLVLWFKWRDEKVCSSKALTVAQSRVTLGRWLALGLSCGLATFAPVFAMVTLMGISPFGRDDGLIQVWSLLMAVGLIVVLSNAAAFANMLHGPSGRRGNGAFTATISVAIAAVTLAGLLVALSGQAWMNSMMTVLSVRIPNATLQLNQAGCQSMVRWGIAVGHEPSRAPSEICEISDVMVFSRIGSYWLIGCESPPIPSGARVQPAAAPVEKRRWLQASFVQGIEQQNSGLNSGYRPRTASYCS